jgi:hypothetical protein
LSPCLSCPHGLLQDGKELWAVCRYHERTRGKIVSGLREENRSERRNRNPLFKLEKEEQKGIEEAIEEHRMDLLVMGAAGRKAVAGGLPGSFLSGRPRVERYVIDLVKEEEFRC